MPGMSLRSAIDQYLAYLERDGYPYGTVKQQRSILYRLDRAYPGRQLGSVDTALLMDFLYGPQGIAIGKTGGTRNSYRSTLRGLLRHAAQMGWIRQVEIPAPRRGGVKPSSDTRPTRLPADTLVHLIESCDPTPQGRVLRGMIAMAVNTAWRLSDISKLRMSEVDLARGTLYLVAKKTGKADAFPITLDLEEELRLYLAWYTAATGSVLGDEGRFVFPGWIKRNRGPGHGFYAVPDPTRHASATWASVRLKSHFGIQGVAVERGEAWHTIRRSVARLYFDGLRTEISYDHAIRQTAALLQHDRAATTEKYLGLSTEIAARNASLRGKRFIARDPKVVRLPAM